MVFGRRFACHWIIKGTEDGSIVSMWEAAYCMILVVFRVGFCIVIFCRVSTLTMLFIQAIMYRSIHKYGCIRIITFRIKRSSTYISEWPQKILSLCIIYTYIRSSLLTWLTLTIHLVLSAIASYRKSHISPARLPYSRRADTPPAWPKSSTCLAPWSSARFSSLDLLTARLVCIEFVPVSCCVFLSLLSLSLFLSLSPPFLFLFLFLSLFLL